MKSRRSILITVIMIVLIVTQNCCVFGATSGQTTKTKTVYKWIKIGGNYDKQQNGTSQDCDFSISGTSEKTIFKCKFYKKYDSSLDNSGTLYCECDNPDISLDPGATVSLNIYLHADITKNTGKGMYMQGKVFFGTPGLDIAGTDLLTDPEYFRTSNSEYLFAIGNVIGFDDQSYIISSTIPKSTKEGEIVSIYFKTTAGVQEWKYQLEAFPEEVTEESPSAAGNQKTEKNGTSTTKKSAKITGSDKTFKTKTKTKKYTVILKSGKTPIKGANLTLKVNKKTYKATTNKKGKATFKIKKLTKKGKYKAVIKFAGNNKYRAASKKVKIIVKK